jgi:hypothetical protein
MDLAPFPLQLCELQVAVAGASQGHIPPPLSMQRLCLAAEDTSAPIRMKDVNVLDDPLRPDAEPPEAPSQAFRSRAG